MTSTDVAPARDTRPPMVVLRDRFEARKDELRKMLPSDIPADNFIRAAMTSVALNPDILGCTWQSIWNACLKACRDGLLPDGVEGAIVPYKTTATWIPMYQGMLRRFRRSGQFKWITANLVREGEEFTHYIDENGEHFRHVPGGDFSAPISKVYSLATTKDGGVFVTVLPIAEANKIRAMSRTTREDAPWKQWPEEMYKKTALRRLCKVLPSARDLLPDEELPEVEAPAAAPELPPASAYPARRDNSESWREVAEQQPSNAGDGGGEQDMGGPDTTTTTIGVGESAASPAGEPAAADAPSAPAGDPNDPVAVAYRRGQEDKARGAQRRALPPEYRDPSRTREALAWQAGHDGTAPPTFTKGETQS